MKLTEMKEEKTKTKPQTFCMFGNYDFSLNAITALNLQKLRANHDRNFKNN